MSKTVKCRIALAVDPKGNWASHGWSIGPNTEASTRAASLSCGLREHASFYVEVEVPIPTTPTIQAQATPAEGGG